MEIFGSQHVWISSEKIANDLLAKRGAIYSDRPTIPNLPDNRTSGDYLALLGRTGALELLWSHGFSLTKPPRYMETATKTWSSTHGPLGAGRIVLLSYSRVEAIALLHV